MFDVAFSELVVIAIVALIVLGPKRLPEVARAAGRWAARIRHFVETVKRDMDAEMRSAELSELRKVRDQIVDAKQSIEHSTSDVLAAIPTNYPEAAAPVPEVAPAIPPAKTRRKPSTKKKSTKSTTRKNVRATGKRR